METSKTIWQKLLEVQQEIGAIKKTEENPFFRSQYFDINGLLEVLKPVLSKKGLVLLQPLSYEGGNLLLKTILVDSFDGERIQDTTIIPNAGDAQKQGSAITYFRRYALQSFFALRAVDDDGNVASQPAGAKAQPAQTTAQRRAIQSKDPKFQAVKNDTDIDFGQDEWPDFGK
jgi:ERF superfamily